MRVAEIMTDSPFFSIKQGVSCCTYIPRRKARSSTRSHRCSWRSPVVVGHSVGKKGDRFGVSDIQHTRGLETHAR